jgi:fructose-1,6-bisphosphatase/inositol monophosphatase family enzyme
MSPEELDECFDFVRDLVLSCGDVLKEGFKDCGQVKTKGQVHDVVTIYDKKIEDILVDGIRERYADHK